MSTPKISLTAFEDRLGNFIFVSIPTDPGRYVRTDRSVAFVHCTECGAHTGEPCKGSSGYVASTHYARRAMFTRRGLRTKPANDVVRDDPDILTFPIIRLPETV